MNDALENKLTMYKAVESLLDSNTAKLAAITAIAPVLTDFKDRIIAITEKDTLANTAGAGTTDTKTADKAALISDAVTIASALFALGSATSDDRLKALSKVTKSSLKELRDTQLLTDVTNIKNLADSYAAPLAAYGITAPMIAALETKAANFNTSLGARETGGSVRTSAFAQLDVMFKETDTLLKDQMDKIMVIFKNSDPQFYGEYVNSREIIDLGHRFRKDEPPASPVNP
jgi:hypothetical protein